MIDYSMLIHFDIGKIVSILIFEYNNIHLWINIVHFSRNVKTSEIAHDLHLSRKFYFNFWTRMKMNYSFDLSQMRNIIIWIISKGNL